MIIDKLKNAEKYYSLNPLFEKAFKYLEKLEAKEIPFVEGNHELVGRNLFAINALVEGNNNVALEAHQQYIDIQYIYSGTDTFGWQSIDECHQLTSQYDIDKDICFFSDAFIVNFTLTERCFVIFFPEDAHAPLGGNLKMEKTVMKVFVNGK
jgi:biofilm protein TabA